MRCSASPLIPVGARLCKVFAMAILTAPPIDSATLRQLSDLELEQELTHASLTTARDEAFEALLDERRRRRKHDVLTLRQADS